MSTMRCVSYILFGDTDQEVLHLTKDIRGQADTIEGVDASTGHYEVDRSSCIPRTSADIRPFFCVTSFTCPYIVCMQKPQICYCNINATLDKKVECLPRMVTFLWPLSSRQFASKHPAGPAPSMTTPSSDRSWCCEAIALVVKRRVTAPADAFRSKRKGIISFVACTVVRRPVAIAPVDLQDKSQDEGQITRRRAVTRQRTNRKTKGSHKVPKDKMARGKVLEVSRNTEWDSQLLILKCQLAINLRKKTELKLLVSQSIPGDQTHGVKRGKNIWQHGLQRIGMVRVARVQCYNISLRQKWRQLGTNYCSCNFHDYSCNPFKLLISSVFVCLSTGVGLACRRCGESQYEPSISSTYCDIIRQK